MIICIASHKGGVGKTTVAINLGAYLNQFDPVLVVDGDPNRSATDWARRGNLPFKVVDERQAIKYARDYRHVVIDMKARPAEDDIAALLDTADVLILPCTPDFLSISAMRLTLETLWILTADSYRVLLTIVPPKPNRDGQEARKTLRDADIPLFKHEIRRFVCYQRAALAGVPVSKVKNPKFSSAWMDICQVGKELLSCQKSRD